MRTLKDFDFSTDPPKRLPKEVVALQDADLARLDVVLRTAASIWRVDLVRSGGDRGTCVLGAGLAVPYVRPRGRRLDRRVVVSSPGQSDGSWCRERAEAYLRDELRRILGVEVEVEYEYGRMD